MKHLKRRNTLKPTKRMKNSKKAVKPAVKITIAKKILGRTPEKYSFYLHDGRKIHTIYELIDELETMSEENFRHFVTDTENHFANWIEGVFSDKNLADELRHIRNKIDTQRAIMKHLIREFAKEVKA